MALPRKVHLENVDGGGHGQGAHELPELGHVNGNGVQLHPFAHGIGKGVGAEACKTVVDDFQHGHAPADDAVLVGQVKRHNAGVVLRRFGLAFNFAARKAPQQGVNFVLRQHFVHVCPEPPPEGLAAARRYFFIMQKKGQFDKRQRPGRGFPCLCPGLEAGCGHASASFSPDPAAGVRPLELEAAPGVPLSQAVWLSGLVPPLPLCGGLGRCGRCRLRFRRAAPPPLPAESAVFTPEELAVGWRLACRHTVPEAGGDLELELPAEDFYAPDAGAGRRPPKQPH